MNTQPENHSSLPEIKSDYTYADVYRLAREAEREGLKIEPSNSDRAATAAAALVKFSGLTGLDHVNEPAATAIVDLLANLMHLCEYAGLNSASVSFETMLKTAENHFDCERGE